MHVRISSVAVFSYVGSGLATGLTTHPRNPIDCKIHISILMSMGKQARGPNMKDRRRITG
jgi:hypothetical protein